MTYRIRTVSEMTGIPRNTLIAWERRYGVVRPERHDNSYRDYSDADVAKLKRIKDSIDSGLSVSEAIAMLQDSQGFQQVSPPASLEGKGSPESKSADPFRELREQLFDALTNYRGASAERLLGGTLGMAADTRIHQIYFPILRRVGDEWEQGKLTVAQEHYATTILREQLVSILIGVARRRTNALHAACTTFPGELHELGALAMSVRLSQAGYRVSHLGADLPLKDLAEFCQSSQPDLVCVSTIMRQQATTIAEYAQMLRRLVPSTTRLVIGGRGVDLDAMPTIKGVELIVEWEAFAERTT
jgi:MerR family transcriptional regulator, light-induced transcriptional regulator